MLIFFLNILPERCVTSTKLYKRRGTSRWRRGNHRASVENFTLPPSCPVEGSRSGVPGPAWPWPPCSGAGWEGVDTRRGMAQAAGGQEALKEALQPPWGLWAAGLPRPCLSHHQSLLHPNWPSSGIKALAQMKKNKPLCSHSDLENESLYKTASYRQLQLFIPSRPFISLCWEISPYNYCL